MATLYTNTIATLDSILKSFCNRLLYVSECEAIILGERAVNIGMGWSRLISLPMASWPSRVRNNTSVTCPMFSLGRNSNMTSIMPAARLDLDQALFAENYDCVPFGFSHNLHHLALCKNETLADTL